MQRHLDRVLGQALLAVAARDLAGQDAADRAVLVLAVDLDVHALAALERGLGLADDLVVEVIVEDGVLRPHAPPRPLGRAVGLREQVRQVNPARLPVVIASCASSMSVRPIMSSNFVKPICAM